MSQISVVIPTLNTAATLAATIASLGATPAEIIVADGGSTDSTRELATALGARILTAPRGRGSQLQAGVVAAQFPWLLLLHADTRLAPGWAEAAQRHMDATPPRAAYFRFTLNSQAPQARRLERRVAWRCRILALPYGDQGLLVPRSLLTAIGSIRPLPLMEDVDLIRRLGRTNLIALDAAAITSPARWERDGWNRRSLRNLMCLSLYFMGLPPRLIAKIYA